MNINGSTDEMEAQREQIRQLCRQQRLDEAADAAARMSSEVLMFAPCEAIADHIRHSRPNEAARLYEIAIEMWRFEGTQATGSGEGLMAMYHVEKATEKLLALKPPLCGPSTT